MSYELRRHSAENLKDIQQLFKEVYGKSPSLDYLKKKYDTGYIGKSSFGYIAYDESGQPVASYTLWPNFLIYRGQRFLIAQAGDVLTHPDHRGKGLFLKVAKKTHELVISEGVVFLYCFPNANSFPGFIRHLEFIHQENTVQYRVKTQALPLVKAANKFGWFRVLYSIYLRILMKLLKGNDFGNSSLDEDTAGMEHDKLFFGYKKYGESFKVKLGKFSFWLKLEDGIMVGDISRFDEREFDKFIKKLHWLGFWLGSHQFKIAASPGTFLERVFREKYTAEKGYAVCSRDLGISWSVPLKSIKFVQGDSDTF